MRLIAIGTQQEIAAFRAEGADMMVYLVHGLQIDYRESEPIQWRAPEGGLYFYVTENGGVRPCYDAYGTFDADRFNAGNYHQNRLDAMHKAEKYRELLKGA